MMNDHDQLADNVIKMLEQKKPLYKDWLLVGVWQMVLYWVVITIIVN